MNNPAEKHDSSYNTNFTGFHPFLGKPQFRDYTAGVKKSSSIKLGQSLLLKLSK